MPSIRELSRLATAIENGHPLPSDWPEGGGLILGITGPPGAGKSSLVDALTTEWRRRGRTVAVIAVDPSSRATGGAILGDRIRMQRHHADEGVFIRSMATRGETGGLAKATLALARMFRGAGYDISIIETVGAGQDEVEIAGKADVTVVVMVPGMGDDVQAIKAGMMEIADVFAINKADYPGVERTEREIGAMLSLGTVEVPIFKTVAIHGTGVPELADEIESRPRRKNAVVADGPTVIDHLGIAVASIESALAFYGGGLGMAVASRETVAAERVNVAMLPVGASRIELLEPTAADSPIAKFLDKRGPGLHHVALRVPDLVAVVSRLEAQGCKVLGAPRHGAGGHLYVFLHPASTGGVLWELIQES